MRPESISNARHFCEASGVSEGETEIGAFARLLADDFRAGKLHWKVEGRLVARAELPACAGRALVELRVDGSVTRPCVRCLADVAIPLSLTRKFVLFDDEQDAERLSDDDDDFDVLVVGTGLDLGALIEDEVMLFADSTLARHDVCSPEALGALGLAMDDGQARREDRPASPFAALKGRSS